MCVEEYIFVHPSIGLFSSEPTLLYFKCRKMLESRRCKKWIFSWSLQKQCNFTVILSFVLMRFVTGYWLPELKVNKSVSFSASSFAVCCHRRLGEILQLVKQTNRTKLILQKGEGKVWHRMGIDRRSCRYQENSSKIWTAL